MTGPAVGRERIPEEKSEQPNHNLVAFKSAYGDLLNAIFELRNFQEEHSRVIGSKSEKNFNQLIGMEDMVKQRKVDIDNKKQQLSRLSVNLSPQELDDAKSEALGRWTKEFSPEAVEILKTKLEGYL